MAYQDFTAVRTSVPDLGTIVKAVKNQISADCSIYSENGVNFKAKKNTPFSPSDINTIQNIINTAPAASLQLAAQNIIDNMPIFEKAILLTMLDQINVLRTRAGLATVTVQQAIQAVRDKAGTL